MRCLIAAALWVLSAAGHTTIVTIEPDDYAAGTDLSTVSPFVTINSYYGGPGPIFATVSGSLDGNAPTGKLTFGVHAWYGELGPDEQPDYFGLGLIFHEPVARVQMLAQLIAGWCEQPDPLPNGTGWAAFDADGQLIGEGQGGYGSCAAPYQVDIAQPGMRSLILGTSDASAVTEYDQLRLTVAVPEPGTFALLALGSVGIYLLRRRSGRPRSSTAG